MGPLEYVYIIVSVGLGGFIIYSLVADFVTNMRKKKAEKVNSEVTLESKNDDTNKNNVLEEIKNESNVNFTTSTSVDLDGKYEKLSQTSKELFDMVDKYLSDIEKIKRSKSKKYITYSFGRTKLARLSIKRSVSLCECFVIDYELNEMLSSTDSKVELNGHVVKLNETKDFDLVKELVELNIENYQELLVEKKKRRLEEKKLEKQAVAD